VGEHVRVGECLKLSGCSSRQAFLTKAQRGAPQACHAFQKSVALVIPDMDAIAFNNDERAVGLMAGQISVRV